ncbi:MAG: hypothetical protein JJ992_22260, partial [Planctomycetes bacterium]|nr:hypothetical protein [Planctomycetota bacterium]
MIPGTGLALGWVGIVGFWAVATWRGSRQVSTLRSSHTDAGQQGLFVQAQGEYLKGHWLESESLLRQILATDDRDGDARLMLASLLRHACREEEALAELKVLELSESGRKWSVEIDRER